MKQFTFKDIESWNPCYCPSKHLPKDWRGNAIDILQMKDVPTEDRLWVVCRDEVLSEKINRTFAVWCAVQVKHLMSDESKASLEVMEAYCENYFLIEDDFWLEAWELERVAARVAARDAAAGFAAWDTARVAARFAARVAARDAAWAAAWAAAGAAAGNAAGAAAGNAQIEKLIEMIECEEEMK